MSAQKTIRPAFQSVELDPIDVRLEAKAAEKSIPTLVTPKAEPTTSEEPATRVEKPAIPVRKAAKVNKSAQSTPRSRMKALKIELPDYVWVELKKQAAVEMVSLRHVIMSMLRSQGISINDADMVEDGRRLR